MKIDETKLKDNPVVHTTALYWDCECHEKFIHPKSEDYCGRCLAFRDEQPDSRISEVIQLDLTDMEKIRLLAECENAARVENPGSMCPVPDGWTGEGIAMIRAKGNGWPIRSEETGVFLDERGNVWLKTSIPADQIAPTD